MEVDQEHQLGDEAAECAGRRRESVVAGDAEEDTAATADASVVDEQLKAMAVSTEQRLTANYHHRGYNDNSTATSTGTRSAGDSLDDIKVRDVSVFF